MQIIQQITSDAKQKQTFVLPDGTTFDLELSYKTQQIGWFITKLTYLDFTLENMRICTSPNILHQFRNQLPFGIGCFVTDNDEPTQQQDFSSGRASLLLLTQEEVLEFYEVVSGQI